MPTILATPANLATSTLAVAHTSGGSSFTVATGEGARFGSPSSSAPIRITVVQRATLVNGQIIPASVKSIFFCTSVVGDVLSGLTLKEGTADNNFAVSDVIAELINAGTIADLNTLALANEAGLLLKAPLASPPLTGVPTAPTATPGTNTTQLATCAFVAAIDATVVHATGSLTETVTGLKTFTSDVTVRGVGYFGSGGGEAAIGQGIPAGYYADGSNFAIRTRIGGAFYIQTYSGADTLAIFNATSTYLAKQTLIGLATAGTANAQFESKAKDASTPAGAFYSSAAANVLVIGPACDLTFQAASSTAVIRNQGRITPAWVVSTDASRTGRVSLFAADFSGTDREGIRVESDGTQAKVSFFGGPVAAKQAAIPDTSGATLANLELEVNKLKQLIRNFSLMS